MPKDCTVCVTLMVEFLIYKTTYDEYGEGEHLVQRFKDLEKAIKKFKKLKINEEFRGQYKMEVFCGVESSNGRTLDSRDLGTAQGRKRGTRTKSERRKQRGSTPRPPLSKGKTQ